MSQRPRAPKPRVVPVVTLSWFTVLMVVVASIIELSRASSGSASNEGQSLWLITLVLLMVLSLAVGVSRHTAFQPLAKPNMLGWLRLSAWEPHQSLPFGPYQPVWKDLITAAWLAGLGIAWGCYLTQTGMDSVLKELLGIVTGQSAGLHHLIHLGLIGSLGMLGLGYLLSLSFHQASGRQSWLVALLAPLGWLCLFSPILLPAWMLAMYVLLMPAVRRKLLRETERIELLPASDPLEDVSTAVLSGPPARIGPDRPEKPTRSSWQQPGQAVAKAFGIGLICAWWGWALLYPLASFSVRMHGIIHQEGAQASTNDEFDASLAALVIALGMAGLMAFGRLVAFVGQGPPPIALSTRFVLRRPLLPRYDVAFAVPLIMVILPWLLHTLWDPQGTGLLGYLCISGGLSVALAVGPWPTLEWWRHCSDCVIRLRRPQQQPSAKESLGSKQVRIELDFLR
ncbi:MAG: hypothetical protein AAF750_07050 [Planctomycetota bacterium]